MTTAPRDQRSGLGRGLAALIPPRPEEHRAAILDIPTERIRPNRYQPRERIDEQELASLEASIREHGILQPILVSADGDGYSLIAGERRLRAALRLGLARIPAVVREAADRERLELALVENLQRADLNALEEARAYRQLVDEFGLTQEAVASRVGRARPSVTNSLRLLECAPSVQAALAERSITAGHARAIAGLSEPDLQDELLGITVGRQLSVRQTEELVRRSREPRPAATAADRSPVDPDLERLQGELRTALATKVTLRPRGAGGRIEIEYYGPDDLDRLTERLIGRPA